MLPRFYCPLPLQSGARLALPSGPARHVQVLRKQPGDAITLFNGEGGEFEAAIVHMGRSDVQVELGAQHTPEREARPAVHLALGIPANERMDWLVEKATELGVASIQPLQAERSVLRLKGERADRKQAHWQAVAVAACEQCGRNLVPPVREARSLAEWLQAGAAALPGPRAMLSLRAGAVPLAAWTAAHDSAATYLFLSGPEGGLSASEEEAAAAAGFAPVTLGPRVLRAETAPLAVLAALTLRA